MDGNASQGATRSYAAIRGEVERMLRGRRGGCVGNDELGVARGDELPAELADPRSRRERLRRCKEALKRERDEEQTAYQQNVAWRER